METASVRAETLNCLASFKDDAPRFERLLQENQRLVVRIAAGVLGNAADAEEVAQEVFLRAYRKISGLRDPGKFRAWVARMSWRLAVNRRRSLNRSLRRDTAWFESTPTVSENHERAAVEAEFDLRLREEINRLPEKLRAVLILCAVEGLDTRAVAQVLEIPEGTVRSRLHLARKRLLQRLSS